MIDKNVKVKCHLFMIEFSFNDTKNILDNFSQSHNLFRGGHTITGQSFKTFDNFRSSLGRFLNFM